MSDRNTSWSSGQLNTVPVAAATLVEFGHMAARDAAGNLVMASDTAGLTVCGMVHETADNSAGAAGDVSTTVRRGVACWFANDATNPVTLADLENDCYVKTSASVCVAAGATNNIVAGRALELDPVYGVKVYMSL